MKISEIYQSRQGEGLLTGTPSVFVRASGCNLRCWFCDTPYASWEPDGEDYSVEEILAQVLTLDAEHVVLTGGEPMLFAEMLPLTSEIRQSERHITVETAGTLYLPVECDLMSISPKLANSTPSATTSPRWHKRHQRDRHAPAVVRRLMDEYDYQIKFVVGSRADCDEVEQYLQHLGREFDPARVLLMPLGIDPAPLAEIASWLEPYCADRGHTFCPRMHIQWFGYARGS